MDNLPFYDKQLNGLGKYLKEPPINVIKIASDYGIELEYEFFDNDISGSISCIDNKFLIKVNALHSYTRKRFTIAHELGHFFLHEDEIKKEAIEDNALFRSRISSNNEFEANSFGADIIMPIFILQKDVDEYMNKFEYERPLQKNTEPQIDSIVYVMAQKYMVSVAAMSIRLDVSYLYR